MEKISSNIDHNAILEFWFQAQNKPLWFASSPEFDQIIKDKFYHVYEQAYMDNLMYWKEFAEGALALVIVFDQFSRNIFRNLPQSYATDKRALQISNYAIKNGFDQKLTTEQKHFLYMPFMHSEDIKDQEISLRLFADVPEVLTYAKAHMEIIQKFGRFPARNKALRRVSTREELQFLREPISCV